MSIYTDMVAAGIETDSDESDLYVPVNDTTRKILANHNQKAMIFHNNLKGKLWYDIPFAYEPWWINRTGRP